ncbi:MAG: HAMP domain-containing histidine kinase [Actinobacteria bacterium]|jgi:two-component system sensor histidine kinase MtrB|nr:HAMP domain-containing histidine kinase [Actinomycetota bacterium]
MCPQVRHLPRARRSLLRRIAFIFVVAVVVTALALAFSAYFITKSAQDERALSDALRQSKQNLTVADSMLPEQPGPSDYTDLMAAFQIRGDFATYMEVYSEPRPYVSGIDVTKAPVTPELAAKVAEGRIGYQTVTVKDERTIIVGSELRSGGLTVYFFYPQGTRLADLARLRNVLAIGGSILAVLGAIAGYLLARAVVRPVREASRAAAQMSQGNLDIRLPVGSDEFGVLAASFNQMAENLQVKMEDLEAGRARERRFVGDVTHELRTPVSALVGEASLLRSRLEADPSACPDDVRRLATMINTDITRLRQLVDDLLEISRLDARAVETLIEPVDIGLFLTRLVQAHGWAETVEVRMTRLQGPSNAAPGVRSASEGGFVVPVDRRRLERILVNLVENALRHGAAPVRVEARRGPAAAPDAIETVQIAVTDRGPGIPIEHLPHIFDRFYKADPSRSSSRGSGLGLAIARENARLLGGDITGGNVPGGGAGFVVTLPAGNL